MEAFCSNMAQQSGVAKVRMIPHRPICSGALIRGYLKPEVIVSHHILTSLKYELFDGTIYLYVIENKL
jgi:hypothetical protein